MSVSSTNSVTVFRRPQAFSISGKGVTGNNPPVTTKKEATFISEFKFRPINFPGKRVLIGESKKIIPGHE